MLHIKVIAQGARHSQVNTPWLSLGWVLILGMPQSSGITTPLFHLLSPSFPISLCLSLYVCKFPYMDLSLLEDIVLIYIDELCDSNLGSKAKRAKKLTENE